jgi:methylmalonyl-CoA/ethylmalonyl-CoA epimerase
MATVRRVDHIAIVTSDTKRATEYFCSTFGLEVASTQVLTEPHVKLTYLDAGNMYLQLVEPLDDKSDVAKFLEASGGGLHHLCFAVDDVLGTAAQAAESNPADVTEGTGRGRVAAFVPGESPVGVPVELTEFRIDEDVDGQPGWLKD